MSDTKDGAIIVKRQNFDNAMRSIKSYADNAKRPASLNRVSVSGGLFDLFDHKVTGEELNEIVSQLEDQLISLNNFDIGMLNTFKDIYKALDSLDREHIAGILAAANAAKAASETANQNVNHISQIVEVLEKFKSDMDRLEHLMDVDKAWEILEEQKRMLTAFSAYKESLSALRHIKDVDELWNNSLSQADSIAHLQEDISDIITSLEEQEETIRAISELAERLPKEQSTFIASTEQRIMSYQNELDHQLKKSQAELDYQLEAQEASIGHRLDDFVERQNGTLATLKEEQSTKLSEIEQDNVQKLASMAQEQEQQLIGIHQTQEKHLAQLTVLQDETLEELKNSQEIVLEKMIKEQEKQYAAMKADLAEEKRLVDEKTAQLDKKAKLTYMIAGGAAVAAIAQLILNIMGVL